MEMAPEGQIPEWHADPKLFEALHVCVKNTFLDCEDPTAPPPSDIRRSQTAPPNIAGIDGVGHADAYSSSDDEASKQGTDCGQSRHDRFYSCYSQESAATEFDESVCSPAPSRKMSEDADWLGNIAAAEEAGPEIKVGQLRGRVSSRGGQPPSGGYSAGACQEQHRSSPSTRSRIEPDVPQPQTLSCDCISETEYRYQVIWTVDARKLKQSDKQAVSPPFELGFGPEHKPVTFKLMIYPKLNPKPKDGKSKDEDRSPPKATDLSFKKAGGAGTIQLKCEGDLSKTSSSVSFQLAINNPLASSTAPNEWWPKESPVGHNFSQSAVCGLPKSDDVWEFSEVVDKGSMTFNVYLHVRTNV